ncbi:MAG: type II toxin-antitoxin system YafQ family toxin [Paludibacteraceae bacterium]|nr:type II toxin-antitoxin system YafQ family toxin [Paludibacteraceae bacterium]
MAYSLNYTNQFKKSLKRCQKRGFDINELSKVLSILSEKGELPENYKPHILHGKYEGIWECHIKPDWLLLWEQSEKELTLILLDTGTHSDIF